MGGESKQLAGGSGVDPSLNDLFEIPAGWTWSALGDTAAFVNGDRSANYPKQADFVPNGVPFVNTGHIEPTGKLSRERMDYISRDCFERLRSGKLVKGDIVYCLRGSTIGKTARVDLSEGSVASSLVIIRAKPKISQDYLYYFLVGPLGQSFVRQHDNGSAQPNLSVAAISRYPIPLPPLPEQKAIAAVLGALDDKIELNRRMNATLEAMARALFQSWFVDFDPVRAKLDGRQPEGMDEATAELFPDSLQDSPIGLVPEGWRVDRFDAHITADRGLSYKGEGLREDCTGLPMHNLNSVYEGGGYKHEGLKYYAGEYRDKHLLEPGDMIVTNTEQGFDHLLIGHAAIVPRCYGPKGLFSHHIYRVRHKPTSPFSPHYLVELFNNRRWHYWISGFSNGTTINMLPMDALEMPLLVVPPVELVKKFTALAEAAHIQIEDNKQQSRTLATLRDTLLPKLLSGELSTEGIQTA
jgi:type I restriction enzyme, S subunit